MAWNEPGGGRDPWGSSSGDQGPPDLDQVIRNLQSKLGDLFGRGGSSGGTGRAGRFNSRGLGIGLAELHHVHGAEHVEQQLAADRYIVRFHGNEFTSRERVETYLLYRAAELTLEQGFDGFTIVRYRSCLACQIHRQLNIVISRISPAVTENLTADLFGKFFAIDPAAATL